MKKFLHVGCGFQTKLETTPGFNTERWEEDRLDLNPAVKPDIIGSITDLSSIEGNTYDAVFSSHNIEHIYPHEVPIALSEFKRVLKEDGFAVITCPDLKSVSNLIADDKLDEPAYESPAGPICPIDILYGFRKSLSEGNLYMAHRCGFTEKVIRKNLLEAGFKSVATYTKDAPFFELWALATCSELPAEEIRDLCLEYAKR